VVVVVVGLFDPQAATSGASSATIMHLAGSPILVMVDSLLAAEYWWLVARVLDTHR
jgi:hypothetical protein